MPPRWDTILIVALELGFAGAMLASAVLDIAARRLPNWLNLAVAVAFLPWAWAMHFTGGLIFVHLVVGAVVLLLGFGLFAVGVIGGGDAKLAAAVAIWIGLTFDLLRFFLLMSLAGGVLAAIALVWQGVTHRKLDRALPYGVAIGIAGLDYWLRHSQTVCRVLGCDA
jgi:prepilin peptidase CpaA